MLALSKAGKNQDLDWSGGLFYAVQAYPIDVTMGYIVGMKNLESMDNRCNNPRYPVKNTI